LCRHLKPDVAEAAEVADAVDAGGSVAARHRSTLVDRRLAVAAVVADRTVALVPTPDIAAPPTMLASVAWTATAAEKLSSVKYSNTHTHTTV